MSRGDTSSEETPVEAAEDRKWTVKGNAALRALLDHVAEELAAEFVRLMRASVSIEADAGAEGEER